jgi:hypothetical protein
MIDHLMTFANEEAAKADPVVGSYFANGEWKSDICVPGVFVWAPASNTIGTDPNGNSYVVRRAYDANWRVIIGNGGQAVYPAIDTRRGTTCRACIGANVCGLKLSIRQMIVGFA